MDKYVGMDSNDKVSQAALAQALREAVETSYRKGGEEACLTGDVVTKQTVKKLIHGLEVEMPEDIPEKKKRIKNFISRQMRIMSHYSFTRKRAICRFLKTAEKVTW